MKPKFTGWMLTVLFVVVMIAVVFVFVNLHPYTIRFETDDNAQEIAESMEGIAGMTYEVSCLEGCYYANGYITDGCYKACRGIE